MPRNNDGRSLSDDWSLSGLDACVKLDDVVHTKFDRNCNRAIKYGRVVSKPPAISLRVRPVVLPFSAARISEGQRRNKGILE